MMEKRLMCIIVLVICLFGGASWALAGGTYTKDIGITMDPTFVKEIKAGKLTDNID